MLGGDVLTNETEMKGSMSLVIVDRSPRVCFRKSVSISKEVRSPIDVVQHAYRCDLVTTILATVWARVEVGLTWKTGNVSLPSSRPRLDRITDMKRMQVSCRSGNADVRVRSCR